MKRFLAFFVFTAFILAALSSSSAASDYKRPKKTEPSILYAASASGKPMMKKSAPSSPHIQLVRTLSGVFGKEYIQKIFSDRRLALDRSVVAGGAGQYMPSTLLTPESIAGGKEFIKRNERLMADVEKRWKVEPEIIAAIIRIETNFGKNLGSRGVFNTLYSIYVLNPKKRSFAFKELVAFIDLAGRNSWDLFEIKGSVSGAIGLAQFIPTSYNLFAVDYNNDGRADLFDEADAIASVAYYLAAHGWGERFKDKQKAVFAYNHSRNYVDDVLSYAWALKKSTPVKYWSDEREDIQEHSVP